MARVVTRTQQPLDQAESGASVPTLKPADIEGCLEAMKTVRIIYHHEANGWWAESSDVEGWSAAGDTYAETVKLAREGVHFASEGTDAPASRRDAVEGRP